MMNYGAIRLEEAYLQAAYRLCRGSDTPVLCDEIQSCAWYEGLFLFRQYGLAPDVVSVEMCIRDRGKACCPARRWRTTPT